MPIYRSFWHALNLLSLLLLVPIAAPAQGIKGNFTFYDKHELTESGINQQGRAWLVLSLTAKSSLFLPQVIHSVKTLTKDQKLGLSFLLAGSTFYTTYLLTENIDLGYGRVAMINYGGTLGYLYPLQLKLFLHYGTSIDDGQRRIADDGSMYYEGPKLSDKIGTYSTFFTFPYGMYAGYISKSVGSNDLGNALVVTYMSQTLGALGYVIPFFFFDPNDSQEKEDYFVAASLLTMGLIPAGYLLGVSMTRHTIVDPGRGVMVYVSGFLGTLTGYALPLFFDMGKRYSPQELMKLQLATATIGYTLGTSLSMKMFQREPFSMRGSVLIGTSTLAGLVTGVAVPLIKQSDHEHHYAKAALSGAWAGFLIGHLFSQAVAKCSYSGIWERKIPGQVNISLPALMNIPLIAVSSKVEFTREFEVGLAEIIWNF